MLDQETIALRRQGRVFAVQGLYSYDVGGETLENLLGIEWKLSDIIESDEEVETKPEAVEYAKILISGTINHLEEIDSMLKPNLSEKWAFDRLDRVTLAILRVSLFCLFYQSDLNTAVVVNEAIELCKDFGLDESYRFVNGIIDKISKEKGSN